MPRLTIVGFILSMTVQLHGQANYPHIPPQDSLATICEIPLQTLTRKIAAGPAQQDLYLDDDKLFTGWACQVFPDSEHRYRYVQVVKGEITRQIGYYTNGQLDHDFHLSDGKSIGYERMWMADGHPYIRYYYSAPGVMHGLQRRWHTNGKIAWEAHYDHGRELSSRQYDRAGRLLAPRGH
ncbi:MAG: hypothetical protein R3301_14235 [Saprospiraceae bacterium]|nr:hypothetical protein [Saprospiraceae bacterium]